MQVDSFARSEVSEEFLWARVRQQADESARESLIALHLPYAKVVAASYYARRFHDDIEFDDYLQFARVGLLEAFERYDPGRGVQFRTYAARRMHGTILDGLERLTEKQRQISVRRQVLAARTQSLGDSAEEDLANGRDTRSSAQENVFKHLAGIGVGLAIGFMLEDTGMVIPDEHRQAGADPVYQGLEMRQTQRHVREMLEHLPVAERAVIRAHYLQGIPFEEIARDLDLSKGRISQIHRKALGALRSLLSSIPSCDVAY